MKRLIIHTGMHKSGSTALQAWLRDNACGGKYYCYRYNGSNTNLGLPLAVLFGDAPETHYYFRRNQNVCALEQLKSVFASVFLDQACCASPVHILSSEDLSNFSSGEHLKLRDFFCSHYDSINVVHVVRDPF